MKRILLYVATFFFALTLYAQQDSLINFYLNDGNIKQFKINDIDNIGIIKGSNNYLMKIFYQDTLIDYFISSSIDSLTFNSDSIQIYIYGNEHIYSISDIDSICFNLHETKISDSVIVIDSTKTNDINTVDSTNVVLKSNSSIGDSLNVGDILASGQTDIAPYGFLRRIKSIKKYNDSIIVETEDAKLTDVIENGIITINRKFTPSDTGKPYIKLDDKILDNEGFTIGFQNVVIYDYDGNKNTKGDQILIDGTNTFNPELGFNVVIEKWKVKQIIVKLTVQDHLELTTHGNIEKEVELKKSLNELLGIPPIELPPITIWILGIPVVVTSNIDLQIGCKLKIGAEVSTGITLDASAISGIEYNSGNWRSISSLSSSYQFDPPELSLGGSLKPFLGPQLNVNFYKMQDAFNAYANVFGFAELKVDILNKPLWEIWGGIEGNAGIESEWFDLHKELPLVLNYKRKLAQATDLIDDVEPNEGKVGDIIKITGSEFGSVRGGNYVGFKTGMSLLDKYQATDYPKWSDNEIQVKIPNGLNKGAVKLLLNVGGFFSNMTNFTITKSSAPQISNINPTSAKIEDVITITGSDFGASRGTSIISFNTLNPQPGDYQSWNDTEIKVKVPHCAETGKISVTVDDQKSNEVDFIVLAPDFTNQQPENKTACSGSSCYFRAIPANADEYQWQILNGTNWNDLTNIGVYTGVKTNTLMINNVSGLNGNQYRLKAKNKGCPTDWVISNPATLTVPLEPTFAAGQHPVNTTACSGSSCNFVSNPSNANDYQWMENGIDLTNGGVYSGVKTTTLMISNVTGLNGRQYILKAKNMGCPVSSWILSNPATLTIPVEPDFTGHHPTNQTANSGSSANFTSNPTNANSYQWQILNGSNWTDLSNTGVYSGVTTTTLAISNVTGLNGTQYRLKAKNNNCPVAWVISNPATLTVTSSNPDEVTIGTQIWKKYNLNVSTYRNGDPIPQVTDPTEWVNLTTGAWCYYNNDPANGTVYGKLYNWYAVNDPRGLAPNGWHIPSNAEWETLINYLGGGSVAGGKMKEVGTVHWQSPNTGATNESGFTALPGGARTSDSGIFFDRGYYGYWWSSSDFDEVTAWMRRLSYIGTTLEASGFHKPTGFSVRCVKD